MFIMSMLPMFKAPTSSMSWAVAKESSVSITGSSNVNNFVFSSKEYIGNDTLVVYQKAKGERFFFEKGLLQLPVKNFKNGNPMLNRDFKKTLKASKYPNILMNFRSVTGLQHNSEAEVDISLAGKTRTVCIKLVNVTKNNIMYIKGKERLKFSDFGLKPPKKVLGFIDVKNELDVEFSIVLKEVK